MALDDVFKTSDRPALWTFPRSQLPKEDLLRDTAVRHAVDVADPARAHTTQLSLASLRGRLIDLNPALAELRAGMSPLPGGR